MKKLLFLIGAGLFLICNSVQAQTGEVIIQAPVKLNYLLEQDKAWNEQKKTIPGFRVQLMAATNRNVVYQEKARFFTHFPEIKSYVVYHQPYFKLRVGDYINRLDAFRNLKLVEKTFPGAFIINDEILIPGN